MPLVFSKQFTLTQPCPNYSIKGRVALVFFFFVPTNFNQGAPLIQLIEDGDQLIQWVEPGLILLGWNENLQPHGCCLGLKWFMLELQQLSWLINLIIFLINQWLALIYEKKTFFCNKSNIYLTKIKEKEEIVVCKPERSRWITFPLDKCPKSWLEYKERIIMYLLINLFSGK